MIETDRRVYTEAPGEQYKMIWVARMQISRAAAVSTDRDAKLHTCGHLTALALRRKRLAWAKGWHCKLDPA